MNEGCGHFEKTWKVLVADEEVPTSGNCPCGYALASFRFGDLQPDDLGRGFDTNVRAVLGQKFVDGELGGMALCLAGSVSAYGRFSGFDVGNPIAVLSTSHAIHGSRQGYAKIRYVQTVAGGLDRNIVLTWSYGGAVQTVQRYGDTLGFRGLEVIPYHFFIRFVDGVYSRSSRFIRSYERSIHARHVKQSSAGMNGGTKPR